MSFANKFVYVADIVNPKTGKTIKEENNATPHNIPLGSLVEVSNSETEKDGLRLFVVEHTRDCDGTPLYSLSFDKWWSENTYGTSFKMVSRAALDSGYPEECLTLIKK